jgi:hypothetical protein
MSVTHHWVSAYPSFIDYFTPRFTFAVMEILITILVVSARVISNHWSSSHQRAPAGVKKDLILT